jgi:HAD superfamily hydrolase (TIGR01509 family)
MPNTNAANATTIEGVVFDLDGLIVNTEAVFNRAGHELLRRRNKEMTPEILTQMMGRRPPEAFAAMVEMTGITDPIEMLMAESQQIFTELLDDHLVTMPGLFELLDEIERRKLGKGVATSSPRGYLHDILGRFDLLSRFEFTLTSEDVMHGKPDPEIYLTAAKRLNIAPAHMLVLEDSEAGTQSGAAAGAVVIAVPHEFSDWHDFSAATDTASRLDDPVIMDLLRNAD